MSNKIYLILLSFHTLKFFCGEHYLNIKSFSFADKTFDITYVRLMFHSPRPESFAIYKKKCNDCPWQPWQYYSGTCFSTYGIDNDVSSFPISNELLYSVFCHLCAIITTYFGCFKTISKP